jgi:hypothetical protein
LFAIFTKAITFVELSALSNQLSALLRMMLIADSSKLKAIIHLLNF